MRKRLGSRFGSTRTTYCRAKAGRLEKVIATHSTAFAVIVDTKGVVNWVDREVRVALSRTTEEKTIRSFRCNLL
jgi:hypothetical protein